MQTLHHRAKTIITKEVNRAIGNCGHPQWALDRGVASPRQTVDTNKDRASAVKDMTSKPWIALPYIKGYSEELHHVFQVHMVEAYLNP